MDRNSLAFACSLSCLLIGLLLSGRAKGQVWRTASGYDALVAELGDDLPSGAGVIVCQTEAPVGNGGYKANPNDADFRNPNKNFIDLSGINDINSGHANNVGTFFFSNVASVAFGVSDVFQYEANDWVNFATGLADQSSPIDQPFAVQNHSWIANGVSISLAENITSRIDYMANENNMNIVVGTSNSNALPQLLVQGYNTISVGRRDGIHGDGLTQLLGPDRVKPEIVATGTATSWTTPRVSAVAAFLRESLASTAFDSHVLVKSLLLSGATKVEFADWDRTPTRPLDNVFGVGELNVFNSYQMLSAGRTAGQTTVPSQPAGPSGWDLATIEPDQMLHYLIEIPTDADHISIVLTWNADVTDSDPGATFTPQWSLSNLDLAFNGDDVSDFSISENHNIEHIFVEDLSAGLYTFTITTDRPQEFAVSWRTALKNEALAGSATTVLGQSVAGDLQSMLADDDDFFTVRSEFDSTLGSFAAAVEIETTTPVNMENGIEVEVVAKLGTVNVEQEIELFNFLEQSYVSLGKSDATFAESAITAKLAGEPDEFVDPVSGKLRAKITWSQTGPVFQAPWTVRIDKANFQISQ